MTDNTFVFSFICYYPFDHQEASGNPSPFQILQKNISAGKKDSE